jgi:hypothetical protein
MTRAERAMDLIKAGALLRSGGAVVGRALFLQTRAEPKEDLLIGSVDSREIADWIIGLVNRSHVTIPTVENLDPALVDGLRLLGMQYGAAGVAKAAARLAGGNLFTSSDQSTD